MGQLEPQWPGLLVAMARLDLGLPLRVPTSNASCLNNEICKDYVSNILSDTKENRGNWFYTWHPIKTWYFHTN